ELPKSKNDARLRGLAAGVIRIDWNDSSIPPQRKDCFCAICFSKILCCLQTLFAGRAASLWPGGRRRRFCLPLACISFTIALANDLSKDASESILSFA
ncbi:MAG: hypothetical protein WCF35_04920, partial [Pseudolabrys sp.]